MRATRAFASPREAVACIADGARIVVGSGAAVPVGLLGAFCEHARSLRDVEVCQLLTLGDAPYLDPSLEGHVRHNAFFIGPNARAAVQQGRADFTPVFLRRDPALLRGPLPVDVALVQIAPPDRHGYCSLGVSIDIVRAAVDTARVIVAEVNPRMPRTHGDAFLCLNRVAHVVEVDHAIPELAPEPIGPSRRRSARTSRRSCATATRSRPGSEAIPNAVLAALRGHRDLGVHTEMFSDGVVDSRPSRRHHQRARNRYHRGKLVTSFVMGTKRLYDFVDDNPMIEMHPSDYVNDPFVVARHRGMVAINSALAVDPTGQVCADSIGAKFYSGVGGQVDFIRGAARAEEGRAILALPSTAKQGALSRIAVELAAGSGVTTTRNDVQFVVTEHGIASLHGKTVRERVKELVAIAHPRFRDALMAGARERRWA